MTNEDAANILRLMASGIELKNHTEHWISSFEKAYEMAIKVLEERPQSEITEEDIQNAIKAGYENGYSMAQAKYQRPQGEWVGKEEYDDYPNKKVCECSECGKMICILHNDFPNFCENCGAYMRGKKNENRFYDC